MSDTIFANKKINPQKLLRFGFVMEHGKYTFSANIAGGQFRMVVTIPDDGTTTAKVIDPSTDNEYVLHRTPEACGAFVGMVKKDYDNILREISDACFELDVFKSDYAQKVIQYAHDTYGDGLEFLWQPVSYNAIFRRKDSNKWYGALLIIPRSKLGIDSNEIIDILDLRIKPDEIESVIDRKGYFPGYHMNKKHWITICLDGTVPIDEIFRRIDESYNLALK